MHDSVLQVLLLSCSGPGHPKMHVKRNSKTQACPDIQVVFLETDPNFETATCAKPPVGRLVRSLLENANLRLKDYPVKNFRIWLKHLCSVRRVLRVDC